MESNSRRHQKDGTCPLDQVSGYFLVPNYEKVGISLGGGLVGVFVVGRRWKLGAAEWRKVALTFARPLKQMASAPSLA